MRNKLRLARERQSRFHVGPSPISGMGLFTAGTVQGLNVCQEFKCHSNFEFELKCWHTNTQVHQASSPKISLLES